MDSGSTAAGGRRRSAPPADVLAVIELQTAVLVRHFEMLRRRTDIYEDLDRAGYLLLCTLSQLGPVDINTLATALGLDPSTAGRQVGAMQGEGLIDRAPGFADRRRSIITPTREGLHRMTTVRQRRQDNVTDLLAGWSPEEVRTLASMFTKYNAALTDHYLTAAPPPTTVRTGPATVGRR